MLRMTEFLPILLFAAAYYLYDIYVATAVLMVAMLIHIGHELVRGRKISRMVWISSALVMVFGSLTLILQNKAFVQWKPTIFTWLVAAVMLGSQFVGKRNAVEILFGVLKVPWSLPPFVWRNLNLGWAAGFLLEGALNLYFVYYHSESAWVLFKTFGHVVLTVVCLALTIGYLLSAGHLKGQVRQAGDKNPLTTEPPQSEGP